MQAEVLGIFDDADDHERLLLLPADSEGFPQSLIDGAEEFSDETLVHDHDSRCGGRVSISEYAAGDKGESQRREITRADVLPFETEAFAILCLISGDDDIGSIVGSREDGIVSHPDRLHAWLGAKRVDQALIKLGDGGRLISGKVRVELKCEQMIGNEADVHRF